jgi:methionyl-tRNA synthetase
VRLRDGLAEAMAVARAANRYLEDQAPWKRFKTDAQTAATSLYVMAQVLSGLKLLFAPYLPFSSQRLHELLGFAGEVTRVGWRMEPVPVGQALPVPTPLFAKLEPPAMDEVAGA